MATRLLPFIRTNIAGVLLFMILIGAHANAQSISEDSNPYRFRTSLSYDVPNFYRTFTRDHIFGPVHLDGHVYLIPAFSLGLNIDYSKNPSSDSREIFYPDTTVADAYYSGKLHTTQFLLEGTYYMKFPDATGKLLTDFDLYATVGLGIGIQNDKVTLDNGVPDAPEKLSNTEYYFARQLTLGAGYSIRENFGIFLETGIALSRVQFGAYYKF